METRGEGTREILRVRSQDGGRGTCVYMYVCYVPRDQGGEIGRSEGMEKNQVEKSSGSDTHSEGLSFRKLSLFSGGSMCHRMGSRGNFSNYPILKGGTIGIQLVAPVNFSPTIPYECLSLREQHARGTRPLRRRLRDITCSTVYIYFSISPTTLGGWVKLQFCGRRQHAPRTTALIG